MTDSTFPDWHGTTILAVRRDGKTVIAVYAGGPNPCYSLALDSEQVVALAIELIPAAPACQTCGRTGLVLGEHCVYICPACGGRGTK